MMLKKLFLSALLPAATLISAHAGSAVVTDGRFTNVYVFPDPSRETWEQHMARLRPDAAQFSRAAIDHYTEELMAPVWPSYFDPLHQYNGINPPRFFGSAVASQACVDAAMKDLHNGVMQWDTVRSLSNCHIDGHDPSPQVTLIFSPDIKIAKIVPFGTGGDMCTTTSTRGWHAWGINVPNFIAMPTDPMCHSSFAAFTRTMSHEVVETVSDPGGAGMGDIGQHELGDNCENKSDANMQWRGFTVERYWSNFDNDCEPRFDPPAGSTSDTWVLGEGNPLQRQTGDVHRLDLSMPTRRAVSDAAVTQVLLAIQTGGDDLRGGNDNASAKLTFAGGNKTFPDINAGRAWNNGDTHIVPLSVPAGLSESDISGLSITTAFGGGCCGDNWNIQKVALLVSRSSASVAHTPPQQVVHTWLDASGGPLVRLTGDTHDKTLAVASQDLGVKVTALQLVISTGKDDLRGGSHLNDDCDVTILLTGGRTIELQNVNEGRTWSNWTDHAVNVPIPAAGLNGGDVVGVKLHTGFGGGIDGDNWNVQRVQLKATLQPALNAAAARLRVPLHIAPITH
jgi:hypothetical protein